MALKMNLNAKLDNNNKRRHRYLDDPERVKKELENERRITRLQQVREKSNNLARHIRQEVAAEKARQIEKLTKVKQQEFNTWREHVLAKKHQDYRTSVFQVGAAHRAAQAETEKMEQKKQLRAEQMQNCRRRAAAKTASTSKTMLRATVAGVNVEGRATAGTQKPSNADEKGKENKLCNKQNCKLRNRAGAGKRKRDNANCHCVEEEEQETLSESSSSSDETSTALPTTTERGRQLQRTPPIILDVDIESEDSLELCTRDGIEINDRHMQTNRKFSRVVRPVPVQEQGAAAAARPRFTQISDLVRRSTQVSVSRHEPQLEQPNRSPTRSLPRTPTKTRPAEETAGSPGRLNAATTGSPRRLSAATAGSPRRLSVATTGPNQAASRRQAQPERRSSLRNNSKQPVTAKVIDAGLQRGSASTAKSCVQAEPLHPMPRPRQDPLIQQSRMQHTPMQAPVQPLPLQQQQQQQPLQQHPLPQHPLPQMPLQQPPMQPYLQQPMHPHALYAPQMMQPYTMMPYPMQSYSMQPMRQYAPQPAFAAQQQQEVPAATANSTAAPTRTTATQSSVTATTYVLRQGQSQAQNTESNTAGRVQFYDHNNKYQRNYQAPATVVQVNAQNTTQLNAMDHALIETQLRQLREQELDKLRKVTESRGEKALQREQVRRDCAELTEKLDALTQQQPQLLPSDANFIPSHRFADLASRREHRMNEAMEQMLLRPAIVTCPEVGVATRHMPKTTTTTTQTKSNAAQAINVAEPPEDKGDDAVSSASCCSLLLDYVNDQSKQLRTELKGINNVNSSKSLKLKYLLQRIEKIRAQLLAELQAGDMSEQNAQMVIESIRKERANLNTDTARKLDERELELQRKEALLEQHLRQLYKQQSKAAAQPKERRKHDDKPVEIIIKVKSDGTVKQYVPKSKLQGKQTLKPATEQCSSSSRPTTSSTTAADNATLAATATGTTTATNALNQRQLSIDSNSTSYRELPTVNYENQRTAAAANAVPTQRQTEPLDPIIAQYIQRLLVMSRNSIDQLAVSSSDVPSPPISIINQSRNASSGTTVDETLLDNQRVERVQAFIQDNRSFVNELEDTLRNQQQEKEQQQLQQQLDMDKESSLRAFDQIWRKRFDNNQHLRPKKQQPAEPAPQPEQEGPTSSRVESAGRHSVVPNAASAKNTARSVASKLPQQQLTITEATSTTRSQAQPNVVKSSSGQTRTQTSSEESAALQMERYAKLTENCTSRIAELTDLITKVREEKQRLVEVTLTSASDGERHSTEYLDLPPPQRQQLEQNGVREQSRSRTHSEHSDTPSHSEAQPLPLQKHKATGASLDSGISVSRPLTALGQDPADTEPMSLPLSIQSGSQRGRGKVPPATIRRYSPQLATEEQAHELSTITEVDTPAQSHIVAAPLPFPSFEQYALELKLDLAQLNADQSIRLQHEYQELITAIRRQNHNVDYREFPSINAYLQELTATMTRVHFEMQTEQPSVTADELWEQLRLPNLSVREFPNRREYMQQLLAREPPEQRELLDSASLELNSSDSFNVEAELRQRRILKSSFRRGPGADALQDVEVASSTRRESIPLQASINAPNESGIEPFSRSPLSLDRQEQQGQRQMQRHESNFRSASPEPGHQRRSIGGADFSARQSVDAPQDASQIGRSLNLREFLTKELLRHRQLERNIDSDSTSDDSLKSSFLQSVIASLSLSSSPQTPALGHATNGTNDRQKTSTPVGSLIAGQDRSGSMNSMDTQLFSVESRISAVHYADGTPPVPYEMPPPLSVHSVGRSQKTKSTKTPNRKWRK